MFAVVQFRVSLDGEPDRRGQGHQQSGLGLADVQWTLTLKVGRVPGRGRGLGQEGGHQPRPGPLHGPVQRRVPPPRVRAGQARPQPHQQPHRLQAVALVQSWTKVITRKNYLLLFTEHEGGSARSVLGVNTLTLGHEVGEDVGVAQHGRHVYRLAPLLVTHVQPRSMGH